MRSDNLKSHTKRHEGENEDNIVTKGVHDGKTDDKDEHISCKSEKFIALEKLVSDKMNTHMKRHERGNEESIVTKGIYDGKSEYKFATNGQQILCRSENFIGLENE